MKPTLMNNIFFVVAILFSAETMATPGFELPIYRKGQKLILSYEEFRRLRPENQEAWLEALREFHTNVESLEAGGRAEYLASEFPSAEAFAWLQVKVWTPQVCRVLGWLAQPGEAQAVDSGLDYNENLTGAHRAKNLGSTGNKINDEGIDGQEKADLTRVSCIYAGWVQRANPDDIKKKHHSCTGVPKAEMKDISGNKYKFSCENGQPSVEIDYKSVAKAPNSKIPVKPAAAVSGTPAKSSDETVVCNPVLFGWQRDMKPLCVSKGRNATKECSSKAKSATATMGVAEKFPEDYRRLVAGGTEGICNDPHLDDHFRTLGVAEAQIPTSLKDMKSTCDTLRERMSSLVGSGSGTGGTSSGQK